jgi:hypothetical protein
VHLWIDDFGNQEYQLDELVKQLRLWFARAKGDPATLRITSFSEGLQGRESDLWERVRKWLGATEYRMGQILEVCKLSGDANSGQTLADLLGRRPRRLLTPAMVWAALDGHADASETKEVLTLSGYDELPLWQAWRESAGSPRFMTGHL